MKKKVMIKPDGLDRQLKKWDNLANEFNRNHVKGPKRDLAIAVQWYSERYPSIKLKCKMLIDELKDLKPKLKKALDEKDIVEVEAETLRQTLANSRDEKMWKHSGGRLFKKSD